MLTPLSDISDSLFQFSTQLDASRAGELTRDFGQSAGSALGTALGTAFPPLYPQSEWQRSGLAQIEREGWRVPRTRADLLTRLSARLNEARDRQTVLSALRQGAWIELARIAIRELLPHTLGGAPLVVTAREISWLAETLLEIACSEARDYVAHRLGAPRTADGGPSKFVVLGMGKLSGTRT